MRIKHTMKTVAGMLALLIHQGCVSSTEPMKPNIVVIMCDDMGFSDLGCYGSEIRTPNIDALAEDGVRFSQFKNTSRCCPSRAALLTGRYQHAVGMGWMTAVDEHRPGYRGQLDASVPTVAEILKANGYATYLSGKWHLTVDGNFSGKENPKPNGSWPVERGFDESYGGLSGGGGYYRVRALIKNTTPINEFPDDYYYTEAITENAVRFIKHQDSSRPMFLYIAHYAPHRPLQAPSERVDACRGRYAAGYDVLRKQRFEKLQEIGLIKSGEDLPVHQREYEGNRPDWISLDADMKEKWITEMATYAAMIEIVDDGIGEVVAALKKKGMYDNTVILFLSDNGATKEGGDISQLAADLSNTPYRSYKRYVFNGGISSPLIVHCPKLFGKWSGQIRSDRAHIIDLVPSCLDLSGVQYPPKFKEKALYPPDGVSLLPAVRGTPLPDRRFFFEHESGCAVIDGKWKLVRNSLSSPWELINLDKDPFEQDDLAAAHPEKAAELESLWTAWAQKNHVLPLVEMGWNERIRHYKELNPDQDGID